MKTSKNKNEFNMNQVAQLLNIKNVGVGNLYWYLRELNIIKQNSTLPEEKYVVLGYCKIGYGTKNKKSPKGYPKALFTADGVRWILNYKKEEILLKQKEYFENLKKVTD